MKQSQQAEWLQRLILLAIGLLIGSQGNLLGLPYDSQIRYFLDALVTQYQEAAPAFVLLLLACYVGLETLTEDIHVENVVFSDHE